MMFTVFIYHVVNVLAWSLLIVSESVPASGSVEIVLQYPDDLPSFASDSNENLNDTFIIRKGLGALERAVSFKFFKDGELTYIANGVNVEGLKETGCDAKDKFAFLFHGWRESCDIDWMAPLIQKLTTHRGGCIICVDYGVLAQDAYVRLLRKFQPLVYIMGNKLLYLSEEGMDPNQVYMFGFSYGGQLASAIGKFYGYKLIKEIDTCDMAGPGFDFKATSLDHRGAAQNVQCIHTSRDKGTKTYECDQNWRMGNCGLSQDAAESPPKGSHGLCPYFYISAFDHPFYAVEKPNRCASRRPAESWPIDFQMGYMESRKPVVSGELFAITSDAFPFNVLDKNASLNELASIPPLSVQRHFGRRPVAYAVQKARSLFFDRRRGFF